MLKLKDWAIQVEKFRNDSEFFEAIGFLQNNIHSVRNGSLSFTKEQIQKACLATGASADYIFGFTNTMQRKKPAKAMDLLKEAVNAVEQELKAK